MYLIEEVNRIDFKRTLFEKEFEIYIDKHNDK